MHACWALSCSMLGCTPNLTRLIWCAQTVGQFHLGEFVNRFRRGSLVMKLPDSEAAKIPTLLFGTINGSIGVVASLPQQQFAFLSRLQVCAISAAAAAVRLPRLATGVCSRILPQQQFAFLSRLQVRAAGARGMPV